MQQEFTERDLIFRRYQIYKFRSEGMVPTVTMTAHVNAARMFELRSIANSQSHHASHITVTHIVTKAVADTLKSYPRLFSFFDGKDIIENKELVLNVPVNVENHVEYIVVNDPDAKTLPTIAEEFTAELNRIHTGNGTFLNVIKQWNQKSDDSPDSTMEFLRHHHGNFIISNFGSFHIDNGSLALAQPIISGLCIGSINSCVRRESNEWIESATLPLTISFDHRPVDGAYVGKFLNGVRNLLENPEALFG
jgi:pyruvate dehydrogenase E2 component (dihydrolipoamide acetyltransferase)